MAEENKKKRIHTDNGGGGHEDEGMAAGGLQLRGARDREDVSEENLMEVRKDVAELAEKVMRYRETGPATFASLLEKYLSQSQTRLSQQISTAADTATTFEDASEIDGESESVPGSDEVRSRLAELSRRFAASKAHIPDRLRDINACKDRLDRAISAKLSFQQIEYV